MSKKEITVVVDGGGSGCRLVAFDHKGEQCASAQDGPASLSLGEEQAWLHISRGLRSIAEQLGEPSNWLPSSLSMGLSGALQAVPRRRFLELLPAEPVIHLITDGHAQLLGACTGSPGICLAVGTGTVMHWLDEQGNIESAGGWGFPVGDEGSGAWLGVQLLNSYIWHRDTHRQRTNRPPLLQALEAQIGMNISDVQSWTTTKQSTAMASLAPIITTAAKQGDLLANSLLERGADQCERLLQIAPSNLPIYLVGGLASVYSSRLSLSTQARLSTPGGTTFSGLYALSKTPHDSSP